MRVITNNPVFTEGNSGFEGYSNADDKMPILKPSTISNLGKPTTLAGTKAKKEKKGVFSQESKDLRAENKATRKSNRLQKKTEKKPKRNAKQILVKKDKTGKERFHFPLSKLFKKDGKWFKKTKDNKVVAVDASNVVTTVKADGTTIAVDKNEIAKATGMPVGAVTPLAVQKVVTTMPQTDADTKVSATETGTPPNEPVVTVEVPESKVEMTADGNVFLEADTQDVKEPTKDASDKPEMSKTQKVVLWSVAVVAVSVIGYAIYRSINKNN
jgi:hypothetical protein